MSYEFEPLCWIRGEMGPREIENDDVRNATQGCPWRKARPSTSIFGGNDYRCTHPAASSEYMQSKDLPDGAIMVGGVDAYATFCEPVNMHLTSLGEPSRLIIDGEYRVVEVKPLLTGPEEG